MTTIIVNITTLLYVCAALLVAILLPYFYIGFLIVRLLSVVIVAVCFLYRDRIIDLLMPNYPLDWCRWLAFIPTTIFLVLVIGNTYWVEANGGHFHRVHKSPRIYDDSKSNTRQLVG